MKNILSKFNLDTKKIALIVAGAMVAAYFDYAYILKSQMQNIDDLKAKISIHRQDIGNLERELAAARELKHTQQQKSMNKASKAKKIITADEIPRLLKQIFDLANENQVRIMQMSPIKEARDAKSAKPAGPPNLTALSLNMELSGDYHRFGQFLNALEESETLLAVTEMRISPIANDYFHQNISLKLKTYVKLKG